MRLIGPNCLGILNTAEPAASTPPSRRRCPPPRQRRLRDAERRPRPGADRPRRAIAASASRRSPRSATAPTSPATTSSSTGRRTRAPRSLCSTSSRSAIRGASPGSRGGSGARSRSWSSRAAARRRARGPRVAHRGAAGGLRRDRRRALRPGGGDPHRKPRRAARRRRRCSPTSRCRPGRRVGDRHQRGRAGDHVRGRLRGGGPRGARRSREVRAERLREFLPPEASLANPVDMIATASAEQYRRTIATLGRVGRDRRADRDLHPPAAHPGRGRRRGGPRGGSGSCRAPIPVQAVFMSAQRSRGDGRAAGFPTYLYPEDAARAWAG